MSQKLILPINNAKLTASWKTDAYRAKFGLVHYGVDIVSTAGSTLLYASGEGKVLETGNDSVLGNFLVILYTGVYNRATGGTSDIICRMWHMASVLVQKGDILTKDTKLGNYGNTGQKTTGAHLHMEIDADTKDTMYTPTLTGKSTHFFGTDYKANDSTMSNPLEWFYCKTSAPDNQTWTTANDAYIRAEDKILPALPEVDPSTFEGIDVSAHNGAIDWPKVKAAGKNFVLIRLGWCGWDGGIQSNGGLDSRFHDNVKGAIAACLNVGVFVYSYAKTALAARIAANETLEIVKPYQLTYPIAFDIEDTRDDGTRYDKMSKAENNAICKAFLSVIQDAGYMGMIYTCKYFAESYLDMTELSGAHDVWIAQYANACTYKGAYGIWQHHGDAQPNHPDGSCPGVTGACDLNTAYKDYAAIIREAGLNGLGKPPSSPTEQPAGDSEIELLRAENTILRNTNAELKAEVAAATGKIEGIRKLLIE